MTHDSPRRVLVVEDDRDSAEALMLLLRLMGCEGQWVLDAAETLRTFATLQQLAQPYPDVVLVDLSLPGMDGVALSRQLLEDPHMSPIVLVSALSEQTLRNAAEEIGAFATLRKPFALDQLEELFGRLQVNGRVTA